MTAYIASEFENQRLGDKFEEKTYEACSRYSFNLSACNHYSFNLSIRSGSEEKPTAIEFPQSINITKNIYKKQVRNDNCHNT